MKAEDATMEMIRTEPEWAGSESHIRWIALFACYPMGRGLRQAFLDVDSQLVSNNSCTV